MEKRKPSHDLERFKLVAGDPRRLSMTATAAVSAKQLGYRPPAVSELVKTMQRSMFYKSMTSHFDSREWQDVYHVPTPEGLTIYLKFTADTISEFQILSFKEK